MSGAASSAASATRPTTSPSPAVSLSCAATWSTWCASPGRSAGPTILTIPTNGLLPKIVPQRVREILDAAPTAQLGVNLSLDNLGAKHDRIRGVPGNWDSAPWRPGRA